MSIIIGTWYFPHVLLQDDPRAEYIKFTDTDEYIYNDGLGRLESTYTLGENNSVILKSPTSSKELVYEFELVEQGKRSMLKLASKDRGIIFTLFKGN